jgi:exonuclease III
MSRIILLVHRCDIVVLNVYSPTQNKIDDTKDSFYEELERVFDESRKCGTEISLEDVNDKRDRENIFAPKIGTESSCEISE